MSTSDAEQNHSTLNVAWSRIGDCLDSELRRLVKIDPKNGRFNFVEAAFGTNAGFTTQLMCSSFLWLRATSSVQESTAKELAMSAALLQHPNGGAIQPYNSSAEEEPLVDIVEFASVAGNLAYLARETGEDSLYRCLVSGSNYLLNERIKDFPGAIRKNRKTVKHDVINASAYAANAWAHAFDLTKDQIYLDAMIDSVKHLISRWSANEVGWWNYAETWDQGVLLGRSVSYQASILALIGEVVHLLPTELSEIWDAIRASADTALVGALNAMEHRDCESPSWSRDWENVFEIDWFLNTFSSRDTGNRLAISRLQRLSHDMELGMRRWVPENSTVSNSQRTRVSTDFRKIANLSGVFTRVLAF